MAKKNLPYLPLYVQDFMTDEKLIECSAASTGVYIRLMCVLHKSEQYGQITLKPKDKRTGDVLTDFAYKLARPMPYPPEEIRAALVELIDEGVITLYGDTITQKRMVADNILSEKRAAAAKSTPPSEKQCSEVAAAFNEICTKLKPVDRMTKQRLQLAADRLVDYGLDAIKDVFTKAQNSEFLTGSKGWKATFDWLLDENNFAKVREGHYDTKKRSENSTLNDETKEILRKEMEEYYGFNQ